MEASKLIQAARDYLGTPFHHQGRQKGVGIDCGGLVECVLRDCGMDIPVYDGYGRDPFRGYLEQALDRHLQRIQQSEPGAILLIKFPKATAPSHLAICTGKNIIHAWSGPGKCVEHAYTSSWQRMTVRVYRCPIR